jgi:type IV secretion system protein VirD4
MAGLVVDGPQPGRVLLGRLALDKPHFRAGPALAAEPCRGVLVLGPARSGKTTSLLVPAVAGWDGAVIATSIRSDVLAATWETRRDAGSRVLIYNPKNVGGYGSNTWSPLIAAMGEKPWTGARRTAKVLIEASGLAEHGANANAAFWNAAAADYLAPLLLAAAQDGPSMEPVMRWLQDAGAAEDEVPELLVKHPRALQAAQGVWKLAAKLKDSIFLTARTALSAYEDDDVMATCLSGSSGEATDITPATVLDTLDDNELGATLYVVSPPTQWRYFAPLFTALLDSLVDAAYSKAGEVGRLDPPLLLAGDEIGNIAPLPELPAWSSTAAGAGIQIITCLQDLGQAERIWGEAGTRTLMSNHPAKLILGGTSDSATLRWAQEMLDEIQTSQWVESRGPGGRSASEHLERGPLLTMAQIRQMPRGGALLVNESAPAAVVELHQWTAI